METTKEITLARSQATKALTKVQSMVVNDDESNKQAIDVLSKIKTVGKMIKTEKEKITKPLNEALRNARELFRPIEYNHTIAEKTIKDKMLRYRSDEAEKVRIEEARIAARVEKGTMKEETAIKKMEGIEEIAKTVKSDSGSSTVKVIKKVRVVDETKIPREYLQLNMVLIRQDVLAGKEIPGAEMYEEESLSVTPR